MAYISKRQAGIHGESRAGQNALAAAHGIAGNSHSISNLSIKVPTGAATDVVAGDDAPYVVAAPYPPYPPYVVAP